MYCPNCGGNHVETLHVQNSYGGKSTVVETKTKGYGFCKGCVGTVILGPIGLLCGLCGMGKSKSRTIVTDNTNVQTDVKYCCLDCGLQFDP